MMSDQKNTKRLFEPTGHAGVFTVELFEWALCEYPQRIDAAPITAFGFDAEIDDLVYVTTLSPETLDAFDVSWYELSEYDFPPT